MANPSPKYYAFRATPWSFLNYVSGHYLAGMADLVDRLEEVHSQEPIYMTWRYTHGYYSLHLVT